MALISIEASHADVWAVLTDYERLPDIVPDLLSCERLPGAHGRGVRLRQAWPGYDCAQLHSSGLVLLSLLLSTYLSAFPVHPSSLLLSQPNHNQVGSSSKCAHTIALAVI